MKKVFGKIPQKKLGGGGVGGSGHNGCERRIDVFVKIQLKKLFFGGGGGGPRGGGGGGGSGWVGGQDGCERVIEVFVKIQKKKLVGGGGVRVDVNEDLKFL